MSMKAMQEMVRRMVAAASSGEPLPDKEILGQHDLTLEEKDSLRRLNTRLVGFGADPSSAEDLLVEPLSYWWL